MTAVNNAGDDGYYMLRNITKVRVVFDVSAATKNDTSLNDVLMVGPTIQETIFNHLIRFRSYKYVMTADIEKMYRQV